MRAIYCLILSSILACNPAAVAAVSAQGTEGGKLYRVVDGKADARTYNGFLRYHGSCNHCHGPDGMGSTFAGSLVAGLPDLESFRMAVRDGRSGTNSVMRGFANDPNVSPYIDDIYAYLQARADGVLGRGRPARILRSMHD